MDLSVLGPAEARVEGSLVPIAGVKPRAILTLLGLCGGSVVSADALAGVLWGEEVPVNASRALQTHVSVLRRALGDGAVLSRGGSWQVIAEAVDAAEFQLAARRGREAARRGDWVLAADTLGEALSWWRSAPQLPATGPGAAEVTHWVETQRALADDWADAALACGRASEIVGSLQAAVTEAPLREHRWAQLVLALYRTGRQGEALRAGQHARRLLREELGVEPSRELRDLEARLLVQDPGLECHASTSYPSTDMPSTIHSSASQARSSEAAEPEAVVGPVVSPESVPLPARIEVVPEAGFVGRRDELNTLLQMAKEVSTQRRCRVALVGGEPGIGKTALAAEFARVVSHDGAIVLYGHCDEDLAVPYKPWADALTHLVTHAPASVVGSVAAHAGSLAHLAPAVASTFNIVATPVTDDVVGARYLMFEAVGATLRTVGALAPVVLCLDDLQWADAASLQLLRNVISTNEPTRLMVVGTFRDSDLFPTHPLSNLLAALRREPAIERISLKGFDESELLAVMESVAGHPLGPEGLALRDALLAETDGNPFFVGELLRHLAATGATYPGGSWVGSFDLRPHGSPVGAREVIGQRVARLGDKAIWLLSVASVIGREFDLGLLAGVSDADEDSLIDVMDRAIEASLVDNFHGNVYSFVHALIEHSLYDSLSPARRATLHRKVAEALEAPTRGPTGGRAVELAHHFAMASGPDVLDKAIRYAAIAGASALAQLAPDEGLRCYAQAISLLDSRETPNDELRCRLLIGLGEALRQAGDPGYRQTLLEAARLAQSLESTDLLVAAALANDRGWTSVIGTVDAERVAVLEAAETALAGTGSAERARILSLLATELLFGGDFARQRELADEAIGIARRCDPGVLAFVANRICLAITSPETLPERLELAGEAIEAAQRAGDPILIFWSAVSRSTMLAQAGELSEAEVDLAASRAVADRLGQPLLLWTQTFREALSAILIGDLDEAERLATVALKTGSEIGQPDATTVFVTQLGPIRFMQGRAREIVDFTAVAATRNPGLPAFSTFLAQLYHDLDRHDEARQVLEPLVADRFASITNERRSGSLTALAYAAYAVSGMRWTEASETLYAALQPFADQIPVAIATTTGCQMSYYLALLAQATGRDKDAERYFSQAAATHERIGAAWGLAATQLAWGRFLLDGPDTMDIATATALLESSLATARQRGYALLEHQACHALNLP